MGAAVLASSARWQDPSERRACICICACSAVRVEEVAPVHRATAAPIATDRMVERMDALLAWRAAARNMAMTDCRKSGRLNQPVASGRCSGCVAGLAAVVMSRVSVSV